MGSDGVEDLRHRTVTTSQNGWVEVWTKSHGTRGITPCGENWCEVLHGRLIITTDGTVKKQDLFSIFSNAASNTFCHLPHLAELLFRT